MRLIKYGDMKTSKGGETEVTPTCLFKFDKIQKNESQYFVVNQDSFFIAQLSV